MKRYLLILCEVILGGFFLLAQQNESVVAKVGTDNITAKELKLHIELSPYIPTNSKTSRNSEEDMKTDFLYSLIAEKLWAQEAEKLGLDKSDKFSFSFKPLENLFVRDALFKKEVEDKVKLSEKDIIDGINKSQFKLITRIFTSLDSLKMHMLFDELKMNADVDSFISVNNEITSDETEIILGKLKDENLEDTLYSLSPGDFTIPTMTEAGWTIIEVKNKLFTPFDVSDQKSINDMKKVLRERRIEDRYNQYMSELLSNKKIAINHDAFLFVYNKFLEIIYDKPIRTDSVAYYPFTEQDFNSILTASTQEELNQPIFTWQGENFAVRRFLSELSFHRFSVSKIDSTELLRRLNNRAKKFVENELITFEGYQQELQLKPSVRKDISEWRQNYLAQFYSNAVLDSISITDDELYTFYINQIARAIDVKLINLRIVTLDDLNEISTIFDKLNEGGDFAEIIKPYGRTDSLANDDGESGLKPVILLGDVGKIASNLNPGEIFGPIRRKNSYSIIQLLEKKDLDDSLKLSFNKAKEVLRYEYRLKKLADKLTEITSNLAVNDNVKIFRDELDKVKITNIPMFLHRFMGFGGRIAGMPLLTPFSEWIEKVDEKKLLP